MATIVTFHAHPDDEAIATGGMMARAAADGHRVILVVATRGEVGEVDEGFLDEGEQLWERRVAETHAAAAILGASRVEFLGYRDSGMMGTPENDVPEAFWQADVGEAASRLAALLAEEHADVLTFYDEHGGYGHPDHIQVHRVGVRAAELAGTPRVYESTMNRDHFIRVMEQARELGIELPGGDPAAELEDVPEVVDAEAPAFGTPEADITTFVDVGSFLDVKRRAMAAHASQIAESSFFLALPEAAFSAAFGTEWFIRRDARPTEREAWLLDA